MTNQLRTVARARTASKVERWSDAAELWERVVEGNPVNGNYWNELADARFWLHDYGKAIGAYDKALELGVWNGPDQFRMPAELQYRLACCHAEMGDADRARQSLAKAMELGLRQHDTVWDDDHLESLRGDRWFAETFRPACPDALPRDDGWQADLRLLAREVPRRSCGLRRVDGARRFAEAVDDLSRSVPRLSDAQLVVGLAKLLRPLGDGHAFIEPPDDAAELHRVLPVQFYLFEEGLFVTAAEPAHGRLLGAEVLEFDRHPVDAVRAMLDPLIARDNEQQPKHEAPQLMRRTAYLHALGVLADPQDATLTVRLADGCIDDVRLPARSTPSRLVGEFPCPPGWSFLPETLGTAVPRYLRNLGTPYWFDHLPAARLVYLQLNGVGDDPAEHLAEFGGRVLECVDEHDADKLVIDLRWNSGGNTFLAMPLLHRIIGHDRINRRGRLFVVVGRKTFSAAQNLATFLDRHTNAVFVGEPTGSRPNFVGETIPFVLPYSRLVVNVSDLYWQTSWPIDHRCWIAPEIYAPPTFEAFRANRDPALEAILGTRDHLPGW